MRETRCVRRGARLTCLAVLIAWMASAVGCGIGGSSAEADVARQSVAGIADAVPHPARFAELYVAGSAPSEADRPKYANYRFWGRSAAVSGNTATVTVEVTDRRSNEILGDVQWTVVKDGDAWKFKDTPLPPR